MSILNGKDISKKLEQELKEKIDIMDSRPVLGIIMFGKNQASMAYVAQKLKAAKRLGVKVEMKNLSNNTTLSEAKREIEEFNNNEIIDGFILQMPFPSHLMEHKNELLNTVKASKDIDGLGFINQGKLFNRDHSGFTPATPKGILRLLKEHNIELKGKKVVVVGTSNLVGRPVAMLLEEEGSTVVFCNSKTRDLKAQTDQADVVISATGIQKLITKDHIREGAIVIDVGISRGGDRLVGDVDYDQVSQVASLITPVPGGVGPMTVIGLMENLVIAASNN